MRLGDNEYNLMRRLEDRAASNETRGVSESDHRRARDISQAAQLLRALWEEQSGRSVERPSEEDEPVEYPTEQARDIFERLLPEWMALFLLKNDGYKKVDNRLGAKGVYPEVNRKVGRLERDLWDGEPVLEEMEPTRRVILDLVGHLFLMLHMLDASESTVKYLEPTSSNAEELGQMLVGAQDVAIKTPFGTRQLWGYGIANAPDVASYHPDDDIAGTGYSPHISGGDVEVADSEFNPGIDDDPSEKDGWDGEGLLPGAPSPESADYHLGYSAGWSAHAGAGSTNGGWDLLPDEIQRVLRYVAEGRRLPDDRGVVAVREFIPSEERF